MTLPSTTTTTSALALALVLAAPTFARPAAQGEAEDMGTRLFAIRNTRDARALAESAREHLLAERWQEAILTLQELIEDHRGDILPARMQDPEGTLSTYAFHAGAAAWATERLRALPPPARRLYRERYGKAARAALFSAHASGNRRALIEVAARWPLTAAAERALWTLGDLEFELGSLADAERAWARAAEASELSGGELTDGARQRLDLVRVWSAEDEGSKRLASRSAGLRLTGPGEGGAPVPADTAEPWTFRLPHSPFRNKQLGHNLFPVYSDDQVFVSTSWQTLALDAYTGEVQWVSDPVPGWSSHKQQELIRGIDLESVMIAPAVSGAVVVSPTQVPFARLGYATFQGIRITVPIPERRLFAYDRTTGTTLWDHTPPPLWEGDSGGYAQRMSLAGPPVTSGSRVLVPCYMMQGRVDFHVACYDLATGERLWSTQLISGQRGLNMFGRHEKEFCAPPVRVEGDRVIVLTQLGTVAAVDLYSGAILWQSLYEQIPLPKTHTWNTQKRHQPWENAAPVVADGVVLATPVDSEHLVAFDLDHGTVLWSMPWSEFNPDQSRDANKVDTLIGADDRTVYFGGGRLAAFHSPAGLARLSPESTLSAAWSFSVDPADGSGSSPRPVLGRDEVVFSSRRGRVAVDRATGLERRRTTLPWNQGNAEPFVVGNLFLGDGMLFTANGEELSGLFDWNILEIRALTRIEEDPSDIAATLTLAQIREQHGELLFQTGDVRESLRRLEEARELLEPRVGHPTHASQVAARLHTILRTSARAHASLAEVPAALRLLESALALAPDSDEVRDTLLQREALLRERDPLAWLETLDELERRCTAKAMPREAWLDLFTEPGTEREPILSLSRADLEALEEDLPVGLWVHLARARSFGLSGDAARQLEELHACLARYGSYVIAPDLLAFDIASSWIDEVLEEHGERVYARFERRARTMLDEADRTVSVRDMELVRRHYPHSEAAVQAGRALLEFAFEAQDSDRVARLVTESLSSERRPTRDDAELLVLLAEALGADGNLELQRGALALVTESFPELAVPGLSRATTAAERLASLPRLLRRGDLEQRVSFSPNLSSIGPLQGNFHAIGELPPGIAADEPPPPMRRVFLREVVQSGGSRHRDRDQVFLEIRSAAAPSRSSLLVELRGMHDAREFRTALTSDQVFLSDGLKLVAIDADTGNHAWPPWRAPRGWRLQELAVGGGVLVVLLESDEARYRAVAYDTQGGRELWRTSLPKNVTWRAPLLDAGRAVFLTQTQTWQDDSEARVVDLYRGVPLGRIDLGGKLSKETYSSAFVREGVLVLCGFHMASIPERNRVAGYDLDSGLEAWSYPLRGGREFDAMVRHGDSTYLVVSPDDTGQGGSILQLDTRLGAVRPVIQLRLEDRVMVQKRSSTTPQGPLRLEAPYLFLYSAQSGRATTPITAVHLPYGKRWVCSLRVPFDELYDVGMAFPAVSDSTVAVAYTKKAANFLEGDTYLTMIDREGGVKRGDYILPSALGSADELELMGLGDALFVLSHNGKTGFPLDVWETPR